MIREEGLNERKLVILKAIIQNYLETGEPVGSRTLSKYTDLNVSAATIRNEMSDLEEMGYIIQPHTSAGRVPSDKGYRLYVDMLMEEKETGTHRYARGTSAEVRKDRSDPETGRESIGQQYQLCDHDFVSDQQSEHIKVHPALSGR